MSVFKNKKIEVKPTILVNAEVEKYASVFKGKTVMEVDKELDLVDIKIGESTIPETNNVALSIVLETKDKKFAIPFSRKVEEDMLEDLNYLATCQFRVNNRWNKEVDPEEGPFTGPLYISFGRPSGISLTEHSLVNPEAATQKKGE